MTIERVIALANLMEPGNVLSEELAIAFLSELDGMIQSDIMLLAPEEIVVYDSADQELMLKPPHDGLYVAYLVAMIRQVQQEFEGYNNAQASVNEKLAVFRRWFISRYRPADRLGLSYTGTSTGVQGFAYLSAYGTAVKLGFTGTEAEWLESLKGGSGEKGEPALLRYDGETGYIQWQNAGDEDWQDLVQVGKLLDEAVAAATERAESAAERAEAAAKQAEGVVGDAATTAYVDRVAAQLREDMNYKPITITSIRHNAGTVELGTVLETVTVSWTLSKAPAAQTVAGTAVDPADRSAVVPGPFDKTASIALTATDERGAKASTSTTVSFVNGVYYGALAADAPLGSAEILQLTRKLQGSRGTTFTVDAAGKRPVFACPSRYGTPTFVIGGFTYDWARVLSLDFANASGYTERYDVWMHAQDVAGSITVTVS